MHHKFTIIGRQVKVVSHMWDDTEVEKSFITLVLNLNLKKISLNDNCTLIFIRIGKRTLVGLVQSHLQTLFFH